MNITNLLALRNHLETLKPEQFDMTTWHCGTAACIAGHAATLDPALWEQVEAVLNKPGSHLAEVQGLVQLGAALFLGLDRATANTLFCPEDEGGNMDHEDIRLIEAVNSIDALLNGGHSGLKSYWSIDGDEW